MVSGLELLHAALLLPPPREAGAGAGAEGGGGRPPRPGTGSWVRAMVSERVKEADLAAAALGCLEAVALGSSDRRGTPSF